MIYRALRTHATLYKTKLIREIFHFLYLPKLYIGFKGGLKVIDCNILSAEYWCPNGTNA